MGEYIPVITSTDGDQSCCFLICERDGRDMISSYSFYNRYCNGLPPAKLHYTTWEMYKSIDIEWYYKVVTDDYRGTFFPDDDDFKAVILKVRC